MAFKSDRQRKAMFARIKSGSKTFKVDFTEKYARVRIKSLKMFKKHTFRIHDIGRHDYTKRVAAISKRTNDYETQSILIPKSEFMKRTPRVKRTIKGLKYLK